MQRRLSGLITKTALVGVSVVLAHELVYLARYGSRYNEALVHGGHGAAWSAAVTATLVLSLVLIVAAIGRLAWLGVLVRRTGASGRAPARAGYLDRRVLLRGYLTTAPRLVALAVLVLSVQENVERATSGLGLPGPFVLLSAEYAGGLWITIAVGLAVALVAALFEWRRNTLLTRLRAARVAAPRPTHVQPRRPSIVDRPAASLLGRRSALRAPPVLAAS
jgi:hypothetical protein